MEDRRATLQLSIGRGMIEWTFSPETPYPFNLMSCQKGMGLITNPIQYKSKCLILSHSTCPDRKSLYSSPSIRSSDSYSRPLLSWPEHLLPSPNKSQTLVSKVFRLSPFNAFARKPHIFRLKKPLS
ncbi:hypothetical protein AMTR_s00130p00100080 [Amborella trichopoda]|uniref:Uncharacterized protein n=1 Tax=Amborella trichopoda TaxID=13333 RepID=W1NSA5_AMBTC|nr:hypothetical protein AMTR_s00130p00100080 [Amborella trichopoda]